MRSAKQLTCLVSLALAIGLVLQGSTQAQIDPNQVQTAAAASVANIQVWFKLDALITRGTYMGDRWVSPPTFTTVSTEKEAIIYARAQALDAQGRAVDASVEWIPADPKMVSASPGQGNGVELTVKRAGETSLEVTAGGFSKKLSVKATYKDGAMRTEISQPSDQGKGHAEIASQASSARSFADCGPAPGIPGNSGQERAVAAPTDEKEKLSYGVGVEIGRNLKRSGVKLGEEIDVDTLVKGLRDALSGTCLLMADDELCAVTTAYRAALTQRLVEAGKRGAEDNQEAGDAFLAENKAKEGVVALPSGLQYKVLKMGDGPKPGAADTVECNYRGTLIDGTEFDSSYRSGKPAIFRVRRVVAGWREGLQCMPVGSKWQLFVPPHLAYGAQGAGSDVGPNATLVFEIELLAIK